MDKTHVGRIMARLQGDVNALQEFLDTMNGAVGDAVTLIGITIVLLSTDLKLGLLTLTVLPALIAIRGGLAALFQEEFPPGPGRLVLHQFRPGREHQWHPYGPGDPAGGDEFRPLSRSRPRRTSGPRTPPPG